MKVFTTTEDYPFLRPLEDNWESIHRELNALENRQYTPWSDTHLYDQNGGWKVYGLYGFGTKFRDNCRACPKTTELVEAIPGMKTAGFSRLTPGTVIKPHKGFDLGVLRCHLGLKLADNCAIRVDGETTTWEQGKCIIFDDTLEHEAWNNGEDERIVLLIDFKKDPNRTSFIETTLGLLIMLKYHIHRLATYLLSFSSSHRSTK